MLLVMNAHLGIGMVANIPKENERQVFIMQQKKRGRALAVCLALCITLLCGGTFASHAVTPVCGGDHYYLKIRDLPYASKGSIGHTHDGYYCRKETRVDRILERCCYCGREEVREVDVYVVHHIDYSR